MRDNERESLHVQCSQFKTLWRERIMYDNGTIKYKTDILRVI